MAATTQIEEQVSLDLKILVSKETDKVLIAEAGKDFVDVLFSFLTLPLGTIVRLVKKESSRGPVTVGCINSLYRSVENLDNEFLMTETCKEMLLQPQNSSEDYCRALKLNIDDTEPINYFTCNKLDDCHSRYLSTSTNIYCGCGNPVTRPVFIKHICEGFVNSFPIFVITDDLIVMPNSLDYTSFGLLQKFGIKNTSSVKEMTVNVTKEKVLDLLKCSLRSKSPLTDFFLGKKLLHERFLSKSPLTDFFLGKKLFPERSRFFSYGVENRSSIKIILKLVIRKSDYKILYAQGEKDFADLLLSFLTFPLGGVVRKLGGNFYMGSIDRLYKSVADLHENKYLMSKEAKNRLVDPHLAPQFNLSNHILPILKPSVLQYYCNYDDESIINVQIFKAGEHRSNDGNFRLMQLVNRQSLTGSHEGYVKGPTMYMATDDLVVAPLSPTSALNLLNSLDTPFYDLKEKVVTIGVKECLSILKASLTSTSALTNGLAHLLTEDKEEK